MCSSGRRRTARVGVAHNVVARVGEGLRRAISQVAARGCGCWPVVARRSIVSSIGIALGLIALILPPTGLLALRWSVVAQADAVGARRLDTRGGAQPVSSRATIRHSYGCS